MIIFSFIIQVLSTVARQKMSGIRWKGLVKSVVTQRKKFFKGRGGLFCPSLKKTKKKDELLPEWDSHK